MSYCPKCGALNDESALFCVHCGASLAGGVASNGAGAAGQTVNPFQVGANSQTVGYDLAGEAPESPSNAIRAFVICMKKYANPNGRAGRAEIWGFWLVQYLVGMLTAGLTTFSALRSQGALPLGAKATSWFGLILGLVFFLPNVCVFIRRLHDLGMSGWFALIRFVPGVIVAAVNLFFFAGNLEASQRYVLLGISIVAGLFWLVIALIPSSKEPNKYGLPPQRRRR